MKTDRERSKGVYDWNTRCTNRTLYIRRTYKTLLICLLHHCKTDDNKSIERKFQTQMPQLDLSHMKSKKAICCLCIAEIVLCTFAFVVIFSLCVCMSVRCALWHFFIQLKSIFFSSLCLYTLSLWIGLFELMSHSHTPTYIGGYTHTTKVSLHFVPNARLRDYSMDCKNKERKLCVHVLLYNQPTKQQQRQRQTNIPRV